MNSLHSKTWDVWRDAQGARHCCEAVTPEDPLAASVAYELRALAAFCERKDPAAVAAAFPASDAFRGHAEAIRRWLGEFAARLPS